MSGDNNAFGEYVTSGQFEKVGGDTSLHMQHLQTNHLTELQSCYSMTFNVNPHFCHFLVDFPCYLHGSTMMTRKDNDFLTYWNDGFAKIQSSGKFKKLCDEAEKIHGEHIFQL